MPRQPTVDGDTDAWGTVLNTYLSVSHDDSGSIVASTTIVTGASSFQQLNVDSEMIAGQMVGANRWTNTTTMAHASTFVTVSAAAIQDNAEVHLTIKSPSDPNSVPPVLMVNSIVDDTSFMIVANQAVQSACPVMFSIIRS